MDSRLDFVNGGSRRRHFAIVIAAMLALVGLGAVIAGRVSWPTTDLTAAEQALRQADVSKARAFLDRYLARSPRDRKALLLAARVARQADACADAEHFLTEHDQIFGQTNASRLEWVLLGAQQGDFAGEEDRLRASLNDPNATLILEALAKGYNVSYRSAEAIQALDLVIDRSPDQAAPLLLRGAILVRLHKLEEAREDFRRVLELAPDSPAAHAALARVLSDLGYTHEAIHHYEQVLASRPGDSAALLGLAHALTDAADLAAAEQRLDELLVAHADHPDGLVERGRLALRRGRLHEAESFLARAVRAAPRHREGHRLYLSVLKELGRAEAALQCEAVLAALRAESAAGEELKLRIADAPRDPRIRWEIYQWSLRNADRQEAIAWLPEVLRLDPQHAGAHLAFADYFDWTGQHRRATEHRAVAGHR